VFGYDTPEHGRSFESKQDATTSDYTAGTRVGVAISKAGRTYRTMVVAGENDGPVDASESPDACEAPGQTCRM